MNTLDEARALLARPVTRAPSVFKALLASAAFAVSGVWLGASSLIGPVMSQDRPAQRAAEAPKTVRAGTEGGFELSASREGLTATADKH
ncbi:MAG: hypothetical protein QM667_08115 [Asticcacaulis sp.]